MRIKTSMLRVSSFEGFIQTNNSFIDGVLHIVGWKEIQQISVTILHREPLKIQGLFTLNHFFLHFSSSGVSRCIT